MEDHILIINNLTKIYPNGIIALENISFKVKRGEFLVIIGLRGSGKSTLLRCINKLHEPTSGNVIFEKNDITRYNNQSMRPIRSKIGMIFQQYNLIPGSVIMNVLTGSLSRVGLINGLLSNFDSESKKKAHRLIELVGLSGRDKSKAMKLSGGQQQRVAIARSLMQEPNLLLADEPVASLDPSTSHSVMKYLEKINKEMGVTIICNLHFLSLVRQYATRVIALKGGKLVFEGDPKLIDEVWFKKIYGEDAIEITVD